MGKQLFLSLISNKQELYCPTYEEYWEYQAKLIDLWEQHVLGYTEHTIVLGTKCLNNS